MNAISDKPETVDAVSIGFNPAAIALACVLADAHEGDASLSELDVRFLERAPGPARHLEALLGSAGIDSIPPGDMVTPRIGFSFAMYLEERDRLFDLGLLVCPNSRLQLSDYISRMPRGVSSEEAVCEVLPRTRNGRLDHVLIQTRDGSLVTRNLVLSRGSMPHIPELFAPYLGERVFHTSESATRLKAFSGKPPNRWLVLGSGQGAAESILKLNARQQDAEFVWIHWPIGFRLPQAGQVPSQVPSPMPADRLRTKGYHNVVDLQARGHEYNITLEDVFTGERTEERVGGIALATGYRQHLLPPLLSNLQPWLRADDDGALLIDQNYRIAVSDACDVTIFVNGLEEQSDGINGDQSYALIAQRADWVARGVAASRSHKKGLSDRGIARPRVLSCFQAYRPL